MLKYNIEELKDLMRSLYTFTGIRFIVYDDKRNKLVSYPDNDCDFCILMKSCDKGNNLCVECDKNSFLISEQSQKLHIYKCHAGLVEATVALRENGRIIGYLMFGQLSDEGDNTKKIKTLTDYCNGINLECPNIQNYAANVPYKDNETIVAAAKLMEACASFILLRELITPEDNRIIELVREFTEKNIFRDFSISELCTELEISRTKLYEAFKNEQRKGVSAFIKEIRLKHAKMLLKTTDMPISVVSHEVGFSDYNYFSRVYKKYYGKSPKSYRK